MNRRDSCFHRGTWRFPTSNNLEIYNIQRRFIIPHWSIMDRSCSMQRIDDFPTATFGTGTWHQVWQHSFPLKIPFVRVFIGGFRREIYRNSHKYIRESQAHIMHVHVHVHVDLHIQIYIYMHTYV